MPSPITSRERVTKALRFEHPDRAPRDLWTLPGIPMRRPEALAAMQAAYPSDFTGPDFNYGPADRATGVPNQVGSYVDEWGCGWEVAEAGVIGEVKHAPLADWAALATYQPPWEMLDGCRFQPRRRSLRCHRQVRAGPGRHRPPLRTHAVPARQREALPRPRLRHA